MRVFMVLAIVAIGAVIAIELPVCPQPTTGKVIFFPNCFNCSTYFECIGTTLALIPCPSGLQYSEVMHNCEVPEKACCNSDFDPMNHCQEYSCPELWQRK